MDDKTRILLKFFTPQRRKPHPDHLIAEADKDLSGKVVVFTGGTDGIGRAAVQMFYEFGASVVMLGRNETKGAAVIKEFSRVDSAGEISFELCDLASMSSIQRCAARVLASQDKIDVLVNCAGINAMTRTETEDGFETNWAINYLGPFLLTTLLLDLVKESNDARIVNLVTNLAFLEEVDLEDLQSEKKFDSTIAYTQAKIAMGMFTQELALELKDFGIIANCLNPGFITSNLLREVTGPLRLMRFLNRVLASPSEVGADRILRLAISSEYADVTGTYTCEDDIDPPHAEMQNAAKREELMKISHKSVSKWLGN